MKTPDIRKTSKNCPSRGLIELPLSSVLTKAVMQVKRIVANIITSDPGVAKRFYQDLLGLDLLMELGWIATYGSQQMMSVQVSFMAEGGSGAPVPDLSIEVDDLDDALRRMKKANVRIEYGPAEEPWGVRRFLVRDPFGKLVNILAHNMRVVLLTSN